MRPRAPRQVRRGPRARPVRRPLLHPGRRDRRARPARAHDLEEQRKLSVGACEIRRHRQLLRFLRRDVRIDSVRHFAQDSAPAELHGIGSHAPLRAQPLWSVPRDSRAALLQAISSQERLLRLARANGVVRSQVGRKDHFPILASVFRLPRDDTPSPRPPLRPVPLPAVHASLASDLRPENGQRRPGCPLHVGASPRVEKGAARSRQKLGVKPLYHYCRSLGIGRSRSKDCRFGADPTQTTARPSESPRYTKRAATPWPASLRNTEKSACSVSSLCYSAAFGPAYGFVGSWPLRRWIW